MNINFFGFALTCAGVYVALVFLAWYAYENDKMSPCAILLTCMGITAMITACLVYVTMVVFGG